ncbi:distal membrane-arm assembly complex protein 1 [Petromyzon marinus]|uniref:Distal membrane-arm assembly complex protein 1 n=1 Tax=Petromyzon marinus TaxID=7757 RepID=A0AAJ7TKR6_PETMA|nr:distal membrane-arm assembly complex protein 1 [Petromyzon marinus]
MSEPDAVSAETGRAAPRRSVDSPMRRMVKNCFACRIVSGTGLIAAGAYVYMFGRRAIKSSPVVGFGSITQLAFGCGLFAMGVVILVDPVDKMIITERPKSN